MKPGILLGCLTALLTAPTVLATTSKVPQVHALTGVRIVVAPDQVIESGTVVLRDGIIEAVGAELEPPPDARVWEREGLTVYPGLIDPYVVRSWPKEAQEAEQKAQGLHSNGLVRPERKIAGFAIDPASTGKLRAAGFTTAVVAPKEGLFQGTSALLNLGDGTLAENLLRPEVAQSVNLQARSGQAGYPNSLMGSVSLFRQTLMDTDWYLKAQQAYERKPDQTRPAYCSAYETLAELAAGRQLVVFETSDVLETLRAARLVREFGLKAYLVGNGREYQRIDQVRQTGLPHLLPVDFPEAPKIPDEDDLRAGLEELRHWDLAPENPKRMLGTGLPVAFTSHRLDEPKKIHASLAWAMERGLTADQALAALTTTPARLLGLERMAGTVEAGKLGNLVLVDGELFTKDAKIQEVWIDGKHYDVKKTEPPEVEPAGTWELTVVTPDDQRIPVVLELSGPAGDLSGSIVCMGARVELSSAEVSGSTVEVAFAGSGLGIPGTINMVLEIEGDSAKGSGATQQGPFDVTGSRTRKPTPEVKP